MKDFPAFTTEHGIASLILREIPYRQEAYIRVQFAADLTELIRECADFCRACGAERVFAAGHPRLECYPLHTALWRMSCPSASLEDTDASLWPVQEKTLASWLEIYNQKIRKVPNGAWMTAADGAEMLKKGDGYFVHRGETLLGIGRAFCDTIDWAAALRPGSGREVVLALAHALTVETVSLTVASANQKAVRLYESMGFYPVEELSRWYRLE